MDTGEEGASGDVHNEFHGVADFVVMARDISGPVTYAPTFVTASGDPLDAAARELARMVGAQWRAEAGLRGLLDASPLAIRWSADWGEHADHHQLVGGQVNGEGGNLRSFTDAFLGLPHRRLVVLGNPGSGKSTLAVQLLLILLARSSAHHPVPVLLSLASWDPIQQHLNTWLADRLGKDYPRLDHPDFGERAAMRLIEARRVLPILDGLDELPPQRRSMALRQLNEALAGGSPVILTCRTGEYRSTLRDADMLRHAAVVHANPISPREALDYLRAVISPQWHPRWRPVFAALADDPGCPLAVALASPLMIGLVRAVYGAAEPARLLDTRRYPDAAAIEDYLLDRLVPTAFADSPPPPGVPWRRRRWNGARAERWLRLLAGDLTRRGTEDLSWWQLCRRTPARTREWTNWLLVAVSCYLLIVVQTASFTFGLIMGPVLSIIAGLFAATTPDSRVPQTGAAPTSPEGFWRSEWYRTRVRTPARLFWKTQLWGLVGGAAMTTLIVGVNLIRGDPLGYPVRTWSEGVLNGATVWLLVVFPTFGLIFWTAAMIVRPSSHEDAATPRSGLRSSRRRTLAVCALCAIVVYAAIVLFGDIFINPPGRPHVDAPMSGNELAGTFALVLGEIALVRSVWGSYEKARIWLAIRGRLPWRLTAFLEDAHQRGVLRQFGTGYQFRHARLRERLASGTDQRKPVPVKATAPAPKPPISAGQRQQSWAKPRPARRKRSRLSERVNAAIVIGFFILALGLIAFVVALPRIFGPDRLIGHTAAVVDVAFSPDGRTLATAGSEDETARLWDVATRQQLGAPLTGHTGNVYSVAFSPDGRTLATASGDRTVRLWDAATRQQLGAPLTGHASAVMSVAFSPDGHILATGGTDGTARLWDAATHQQIGDPITDPVDAVDSVAFSPDGRTLATGGDDGTVRLWDAATHQQAGVPLTGHTDFVSGMAFGPDSRTLATASGDRTVRLWDATTHRQIGEPLTGHTDELYGVAFKPDGRILATGGADGAIRLWNVTTHQPIGSPFTCEESINESSNTTVFSVAFSPDGDTLAVGCGDREAKLWDVADRR